MVTETPLALGPWIPTDDERERARLRPRGRPQMLQTWRDLVFLHFPVEPNLAQQLLPPGLAIDTYPDDNGRQMAWLGLVAFRVSGTRHPWGPAIPGLSAFSEINIRTYAHLEGREPGVWFCSLDGAPWLTRLVAQLTYKIGYEQSSVQFGIPWPGVISYTSLRKGGPRCCLAAVPVGQPEQAKPGSLAWFLFERYQLYACSGGRLYRARVCHPPYDIREAEVIACDTNLCSALGIAERPWHCAHYCARVNAEFYPLERA